MSTRADRFTQLNKIPDLFSDFLTDLTPHPLTKDLARTTNDGSIKQSIKNLILTNYGERPFQSNLGSKVNRSLFNLNDGFLEDDLESSIRATIEQSEPRVLIQSIRVTTEDNQVIINIQFLIINSLEPRNLDVILRRVR
jgi:phage baseplate assembly protein W